MDPNQLLDLAKQDIYAFEYEKAHEKLLEAHRLNPTNTEVLDLHSEVLIEVGMIKEAKEISFLHLHIYSFIYSI